MNKPRHPAPPTLPNPPHPCSFLIESIFPNGHSLWHLACLLPPSAISHLAYMLGFLEMAGQGAKWSTYRRPVTTEVPFSIDSLVRMLLLDVTLYAGLTLYLDKVAREGDCGVGGGVLECLCCS